MNIDKLDKIILSKEDVDSLFEWRDNHKDYVRNFKPVLTEGVIVIDDYHTQVFKETATHYHYTIYYKGLVKSYELEWEKATHEGRVIYTADESLVSHDYNMSIISLHASIMAYMEYYSDKKEYVEVNEVSEIKNKKPKKKSSGKSKKSPIRIKKKVYKVRVDNNAVTRDKVRYERKAEKWTVRGHWREYKSGKKIWVEAYVKGDGKEVTPKNYKL